jgi:hypothetical protein
MKSLVKPPHNCSPGSILPATSRYTLAVSRNQMDRDYGRGSSFSQVLRPFITSFPGKRTNNRAPVLIFGCILPYTYLYESKRCFVNEILSRLSEVGDFFVNFAAGERVGHVGLPAESIRKTGGPALLLRAFLRPQACFCTQPMFWRAGKPSVCTKNGACTEVQTPNKMQTHKQAKPSVLRRRFRRP